MSLTFVSWRQMKSRSPKRILTVDDETKKYKCSGSEELDTKKTCKQTQRNMKKLFCKSKTEQKM